MNDTTEKKLTLHEHLTRLKVDLERSELIWLGGKVSRMFKEKYPDEQLKKVYRPNDRGKHIAAGLGYDERVIPIIDELIQL